MLPNVFRTLRRDRGFAVLVGGAVLAVALLTVGVHALRAATADPVRALRSE